MRLRTRKKNLVPIYCVKDQGNGTKIEVTVRSCCEKQFEKKKTLREALKFFDCRVTVKCIWNNSYLNCGCGWKWRMIIVVNLSNWKEEAWKKKKKKKKKIRASTGFEPVTSTIPVRCSTNWTMKPHIGSEVNLLISYLPVQWNDVKCIWNNSFCRVTVRRQFQTSYKNHTTSLRVCTVWFCGS